jgi:hypothetical protein
LFWAENSGKFGKIQENSGKFTKIHENRLKIHEKRLHLGGAGVGILPAPALDVLLGDLRALLPDHTVADARQAPLPQGQRESPRPPHDDAGESLHVHAHACTRLLISRAQVTDGRFLGEYRTANGFCACPLVPDINQPQCQLSVASSGPCSLQHTIQALRASQADAFFTSLVFQPVDDQRSPRPCTMQLDWPNVNNPLRDGST